jgi:hypothetical protein
MKIAIVELIEHAPVTLLKEYFANQSFAKEIDWNGNNKKILTAIVKVIGKMNDHDQEPLLIEAERLHLLTDELGQNTLDSLFYENKEFLKIKNAYHKSLWAFMYDNINFKRAEMIHYTEKYLKNSISDGYLAPQGIDITCDPEQIMLFEEEVGKFFMEAEDHKVDIFNRYIVDNMKQLVKVFQVIIYLRRASEPHLEFSGDDDQRILISKFIYPIENISITYEPNGGQLNIRFKGDDESKKEIVKIFAKTLLQLPSDAATVTLKRYIIDKFLKPYELITDPEDGIESVKVVSIMLQPFGYDAIINVQCSPDRNELINEVAQEFFKRFPLCDHFIATGVIILINLFSDRTNERNEILSVEITYPNGCKINSQTPQERLLVENYLQRWGLIEEVIV